MRGVIGQAHPHSGLTIVQAVGGLALVALAAQAAPAAAASYAAIRTGGQDLELGGEFEPAIAVNPTDPLNVAVATAGRLRVSTDGGETFGPAVVPALPGTHGLRGDPGLAFDRFGRLFWLYQTAIYDRQANEGLRGRDEFIAQCDPQTGEILPGYPVNVTLQAGFPAEDGNQNDKPWLAVDLSASSPFADRLYIAWWRIGTPYTTISHSTDQGITWSSGLSHEGSVQTNPVVHLATAPNGDVYMAEHRQPGFYGVNPDGVSGYVQVYRSTDGGETFPQESQAYSPGEADITYNLGVGPGEIPGVQFVTIGSTQPWILPDPLVSGRIHVVACDDPDNDHSSGDSSDIYITTSSDYGQTWDTPRRVDAGPAGTLQVMPAPAIDPASGNLVVHYYDNRVGVLNAGGNYLLDVFMATSTDGGQTFRPDVGINDLPFDPDPGVMCFSGGKTIFDVWVGGESLAIAVGTGQRVLRFDGSAWTTEFVGFIQGLNAVWGSAEDSVFVAGLDGVIYRYNGSSWARQESGTTENLYALHGRSGTDVLAVGAGGTILHYDGQTWSSMSSGTTEDLFGVWMSPSGKAYAGGSGGTLLKFDGAWITDSLGTTERINDLWGTADDNIFAVGEHGNIFRFDGSTWTSMLSGLPLIYGIWGSSETDVFAIGWGIVHFDGNNWSYSAFSDEIMARVDGSSPTNAVVVGYSGRIGRSNGTAWVSESSPWSPVNPVTKIGEYNGMAIGGGRQYAVWCGNMFDEGMNAVEGQMIFDGIRTAGVPGTGPVLAGVVLEPARPNPFRASTALSFELPLAANVRVSVHDAAGRTVAVITEGWMSAGRHAVSWDGFDGSGGRARSGVYFLRLDAEGLARTNKLVLIE